MRTHTSMEEQPQAPEQAEVSSAGKWPSGKGPGHPVHEEKINKMCCLLRH